MRDRHDGHPLGAALILVAIFSVAWAFHLATPRVPESIPARATAPAVTVVTEVAAHPPSLTERSVSSAQRREPEAPRVLTAPGPVVETVVAVVPSAPPIAPVASLPALAAFSWSTVSTPYPSTVWPTAGGATPVDRGAVTQAFATAGAAVRTAFKKAF